MLLILEILQCFRIVNYNNITRNEIYYIGKIKLLLKMNIWYIKIKFFRHRKLLFIKKFV